MSDLSFDPRDVALTALANLIRLMGAELAAGRHRDDIDLFEKAVRSWLGSTPALARSLGFAEAGL